MTAIVYDFAAIRAKSLNWQDTPEDKRLTISRYNKDVGNWTFCEFKDLQKGDIFKAYFRGLMINLFTGAAEQNKQAVNRASSRAQKDIDQGYGYSIISWPFNTLEEALNFNV